MKKRKNASFPLKSVLLLAAAGLLLLGSTVGSTRAALTYYSEDYAVQVSMNKIGVTLLENGEAVSSRDYQDDGSWDEAQIHGTLLTGLLAEGEKFAPGRTYPEVLQVSNTGNIDTYVRVTLTKSWVRPEDESKDTVSDPALELIQLGLTQGNGWIEADGGSDSPERVILYYSPVLEEGFVSEPLMETIRIDNQIAEQVKVVTTQSDDGTVTKQYEYVYGDYIFCLEAEVNAVQTHNAEEAIKSAWGVDVTLNADGSIASVE